MRTALHAGLLALSCSCAGLWRQRAAQGVSIETEPRGAQVYFDDKLQCITPCQIALSRASSDASLVLKKEGYFTRTMRVDAVAHGATAPNLAGTFAPSGDSAQRPTRARGQIADYVPKYRFALQPLPSNRQPTDRARPAFLDEGGFRDSSSGAWTDTDGQRRK